MDEDEEKKMTVPLVLELKKLLSDILVSEKMDLRKKAMEDAMKLIENLEMDGSKAEKFLKTDNIKKGNKMVEEILKEVDKLEYASDEEMEDIEKTYIDSSEE